MIPPVSPTAALTWGKQMEQTIFMICMFFGIAAVALIAFTLLMIALGRVDV